MSVTIFTTGRCTSTLSRQCRKHWNTTKLADLSHGAARTSAWVSMSGRGGPRGGTTAKPPAAPWEEEEPCRGAGGKGGAAGSPALPTDAAAVSVARCSCKFRQVVKAQDLISYRGCIIDLSKAPASFDTS